MTRHCRKGSEKKKGGEGWGEGVCVWRAGGGGGGVRGAFERERKADQVHEVLPLSLFLCIWQLAIPATV